jgi:cytochrome c oxidase assembly factor CtaG
LLFSAHMAQHMAFTVLVPLLLVLAAPVTLALRALPSEARRGQRSPRDVPLGVPYDIGERRLEDLREPGSSR